MAECWPHPCLCSHTLRQCDQAVKASVSMAGGKQWQSGKHMKMDVRSQPERRLGSLEALQGLKVSGRHPHVGSMCVSHVLQVLMQGLASQLTAFRSYGNVQQVCAPELAPIQCTHCRYPHLACSASLPH